MSFKKGYKPWNKNTKGIMVAWNKGKKRPPFSDEWKQKISFSKKGKKITEITRERMKIAQKGKIVLPETRLKISNSLKGKIPKFIPTTLGTHRTDKQKETMSNAQRKRIKNGKHNWWKGGISSENHRIRNGVEFRLWREAVFARDNWTCQKTGKRCIELHPHHILPFAYYPELRFAIDNGITLSKDSHREFHKIYGIKNNTLEQLNEFLKK